ncbi:hypothetical protein B0H14DRAFT_3423809 [Mycena olivaceomarginata]|nr:hypothetical protein B0H14DRAFT_3423809 [Mycena olivaceomarginata]
MQSSLRASEATSLDHPNPISPVTQDADMPVPADTGEPDEAQTVPAVPAVTKPVRNAPKVHQERSGFTGDRVLRNSQN